MKFQQYVPSDQPLAAAFRIGPHVFFIIGCTLGILTVFPAPVYGGLPIGQFGAGSFALGLAISAGYRLSGKQYFRPMLAVIVAAVLGAIATGLVTRIGAATATQILTAVYFVWVVIDSMTDTGINTDEDPIKEGARSGQGFVMGGGGGGE